MPCPDHRGFCALPSEPFFLQHKCPCSGNCPMLVSRSGFTHQAFLVYPTITYSTKIYFLSLILVTNSFLQKRWDTERNKVAYLQLYCGFSPLWKSKSLSWGTHKTCATRSLRKYIDSQIDCLTVIVVTFKSERHIHFSGLCNWKMASWFLAHLDNLIRPGMVAPSPYWSGPSPALPCLPSSGFITGLGLLLLQARNSQNIPALPYSYSPFMMLASCVCSELHCHIK